MEALKKEWTENEKKAQLTLLKEKIAKYALGLRRMDIIEKIIHLDYTMLNCILGVIDDKEIFYSDKETLISLIMKSPNSVIATLAMNLYMKIEHSWENHIKSTKKSDAAHKAADYATIVTGLDNVRAAAALSKAITFGYFLMDEPVEKVKKRFDNCNSEEIVKQKFLNMCKSYIEQGEKGLFALIRERNKQLIEHQPTEGHQHKKKPIKGSNC